MVLYRILWVKRCGTTRIYPDFIYFTPKWCNNRKCLKLHIYP